MVDVLIADDDLDDLHLMKSAIAETGSSFTFHTVNNGKEALDYLVNLKGDKLPCLIILDYNMPQLNGYEVLSKLHDDPRFHSVPKVIVSTSINSKYVDQCLSSGAVNYFVKPNNIKDLNEMVEKILSYCRN